MLVPDLKICVTVFVSLERVYLLLYLCGGPRGYHGGDALVVVVVLATGCVYGLRWVTLGLWVHGSNIF